MINNLSRKILVAGIILLFVGISAIPLLEGNEVKKQFLTYNISTYDKVPYRNLINIFRLETSNDLLVIRSSASVGDGLPDFTFIKLHAWWGLLNTTGIFVEYDINNSGDTYQIDRPIVSNLSFFADNNTTSFGYILQTPMFYPSTWYHGEILGGNNFFEMDEKPNAITVKIDYTNLVPEVNETNNNLTVSVVLGVTISGTVYEKKNDETVPFEGVLQLNRYDEVSLSDFGCRHYWSDENGHYNMSIFPKDPIDEPHTYCIMASNTTTNLKILKKSSPVEAGGNTTLNFFYPGVIPDKPNKPWGVTFGRTNRTYLFFSSNSDPYGSIFYKFYWGDGTYSDWLGPYDSNEKICTRHVWGKPGSYPIEVIYKDSLGMLSGWSDPLTIKISESIHIGQFLLQFLEKFINVAVMF